MHSKTAAIRAIRDIKRKKVEAVCEMRIRPEWSYARSYTVFIFDKIALHWVEFTMETMNTMRVCRTVETLDKDGRWRYFFFSILYATCEIVC